jgi:hypothetical protein
MTRLSLSANQIDQEGLATLSYLPHLTFLGLFGNRLTDFEGLLTLFREKVPHLKEIYIAANPCTMESSTLVTESSLQLGIETTPSCRERLQHTLPQLRFVDGIPLTPTTTE